ncbi:PEP-CTERM sorting domain-containing protein [Chamaesiphon sp. GL140_3_metabinner_50]|uniref:PEP-CTERM sorting domain-containing protein n=1 Tax=Chamaesiphon sp. GL140_3_metabinner_50 TaxID=2970812 RepID=UPI0025D53ED0|nr:PEP-CTERM sorting domain-containing protein [Chamaesiphon sp. GL140_3_metabinner_50]
MKSASLAISATSFLRAKLAIGGIGLITASVVSIPIAASAADLYFSDFSNGTIGKITSLGAVSTFASGFNSPRGIAFDASGNLYVSDQSAARNNSIKKITPSGNVSTFVSGLADPVFGLAFDASGNLFAANYFADNIEKITPSGNVSTFVSGLRRPYDLAFDASGNLFETDFDILSGARINKITPLGNVTSNPGSALSAFTGLAVDSSGNAALSDVGRNIIIKFSTTTLASTGSINGLSGDLAFDESGNLFVADSGRIEKINTLGSVSTFATTGNTPFSIAFAPTLSTPAAVPEPFTVVGTLIGGTAALRMRKKLRSTAKS